MDENIRSILLQPNFIPILLECTKYEGLLLEFDRLTCSNMSLKGSRLELLIDETTGKLEDDIKKFIIFVDECIYSRLQ